MTFGDLLDRERMEGETTKMIELVIKKMKKRLPVKEIAEQLEEKEEVIQMLYDIITEIGIDVSVDEVLDKYLLLK